MLFWKLKVKIAFSAIAGAVLLLLAANASAGASSEEWNRTFGGLIGNDTALDVQQTSDGGYIIAATTMSFGAGGEDAWIIKTRTNGTEQWSKTFGGLGEDIARSIQQTNDGGYIIGGHTNSIGAGKSNFWLIKTDANGNQQWSKTYGADNHEWGMYAMQTSDGGHIIVGYAELKPPLMVRYHTDVWLIKTDANGNEQWSKTFGARGTDEARFIQQTSDGGYVIAGLTDSYGIGGEDFYLIKTDANGNEQWSKTFGKGKDDWANEVRQTTDGGYILIGGTETITGAEDAWLIKTDANGDEQWNKTFGGKKDDWGTSVWQTSEGGYIITVVTESFGAGKMDAWIIKTDANGNEQWNKTFGGTSDDWSVSVQQTSDKGYIFAGGATSFGKGTQDVWIVKVSQPVLSLTPISNLKATPSTATSTPAPTLTPTPALTATPTPRAPGFETIYAAIGLSAIYIALRKSKT